MNFVRTVFFTTDVDTFEIVTQGLVSVNPKNKSVRFAIGGIVIACFRKGQVVRYTCGPDKRMIAETI